jgi:casein kinase II subunit alpha
MRDIERYELISKVGKGKYSEVFIGINTSNDQQIVAKILKPVKKSKVKREIKILSALKHPNIVRLNEVVRDPASKTTSLVPIYSCRYLSG